MDALLAARLRTLRRAQGWSLEDLAARSGVSRATLSRLETGEVSPTASVLGRLCAAYGMTLSRLMRLVEDGFPAVVRAAEQPVWTDRTVGFERRQLSPPARRLAGEVLACRIGPGERIAYDRPPRPDLEHHLVLLEGALTVTVDGVAHRLAPGDCLRYQLAGKSQFETPPEAGAHYHLFLV